MLKLKLILGVCTAMFAFVLFAEKPISVAFWDEPTVSEADGRVASLVWEYYKSELATHSRLKLISSTEMLKVKEGLKTPPTIINATSAKMLCKAANADVVCAGSIIRSDDKYTITVNIFDKDGNSVGSVKEDFKATHEADLVTFRLARATAIKIRGENPVDYINAERELRLESEIARIQKEDKIKKEQGK